MPGRFYERRKDSCEPTLVRGGGGRLPCWVGVAESAVASRSLDIVVAGMVGPSTPPASRWLGRHLPARTMVGLDAQHMEDYVPDATLGGHSPMSRGQTQREILETEFFWFGASVDSPKVHDPGTHFLYSPPVREPTARGSGGGRAVERIVYSLEVKEVEPGQWEASFEHHEHDD